MKQFRANVYPLILAAVAVSPLACSAADESPADGAYAAGAAEDDGAGVASEVGEARSEIIGGFVPWPNKSPWLARITRNGGHHCGGSLVHPSWVLTAAHCVSGFDRTTLRVVMGDHTIDTNDGTEQTRSVAEGIVHPSFAYSGGAPFNDVALLRLSTPVTINENAQTIALPASTPSVVCDLVGWGETAKDSGPSNLLQQVNVGIRPVADCNASPLLTRDLVGGELCAGTPTSGGCHGDSGGPMYHRATGGRITQLGIVSWGKGDTCNSHTVFTRVQSFNTWIQNTINVPLRRNVRMTWNGNLSQGNIRLSCSSTGEVVSGPIDVDGVEISLDCPNANVTASCTVTSSGRSVDGFTRRVGGVTTSLPYTSTSGTNTFLAPSSGTVDYWCGVTD